MMVYRFPEDAHTVAYGRTQHGTHGTRARAAPIDMAASLLCFADLSFNNIEKIEGLEALTQIPDLSLRHNQISTLEGDNNDILRFGKRPPPHHTHTHTDTHTHTHSTHTQRTKLIGIFLFLCLFN